MKKKYENYQWGCPKISKDSYTSLSGHIEDVDIDYLPKSNPVGLGCSSTSKSKIIELEEIW